LTDKAKEHVARILPRLVRFIMESKRLENAPFEEEGDQDRREKKEDGAE
jgi:hypothetical protein